MAPNPVKQWAVIAVLIPVCFSCLVCIDLTNEPKPAPGSTGNGNFMITEPVPGSIHANDSAIAVTWTCRSGGGGNVYVYLYKGDSMVQPIGSFKAADTTISKLLWPMDSGSDYRIKVVSEDDTSRYDFGGYFTLFIRYSGAISVTQPKAGIVAHPDSTIIVTWTTTGTLGPDICFQLYNDTSYVSMIECVTKYPSEEYSFVLPRFINAGNRYRIKVSSYYAPSIHGFSDTFSISYTGRIAVTRPAEKCAWAAGMTDSIQWISTGSAGLNASIELFRDNTNISSIIPDVPISKGSYSWPVPFGMASSKRYRIRIQSLSDTSITAMSGYFSIAGVAADTFECDDSSSVASGISVDGTVQSRTLTNRDIDWIGFPAMQDSVYVVRIGGAIEPGSFLCSRPDSIVNSRYGSTSDMYVWKASAARRAFVKVFPRNTNPGNFGEYSISVKQTSENRIVAFLTPTDTVTWEAGSTYNIQWVSDTVVLGQYVDLIVEKGKTGLEYLSRQHIDNKTAAYSLTVPAGMASGSDYRIRLTNSRLIDISAYSDSFQISGMAADSFESDNTVYQATILVADGREQVHTLTFKDVDWIKFNAQPGMLYRITLSCTPQLKAASVTIYDSASFSELRDQWVPDSAAAVFYLYGQSGKTILMSVSYPVNYGIYHVSAVALDTSLYGIKVALPEAGSTYRIGQACGIQWVSNPLFDRGLDIVLCNASGKVHTIYESSSMQANYYSWVIPPSIIPGIDYYIKIISKSSGMAGASGTFKITK